MSFLGKNIRKIRAVKNLTQTEFADLFSLSRSAVGAYEEGRAEAKISTVIAISDYFRLSLDSIFNSELTVYDILHYKNFLSTNKINEIIFVAANFLDEFYFNQNKLDFISKQPKIIFPVEIGLFSHAFEYNLSIKNLSNIELFEGDILFCKKNACDEGDFIVFEENSVSIKHLKKPVLDKEQGFFKILKVLS